MYSFERTSISFSERCFLHVTLCSGWRLIWEKDHNCDNCFYKQGHVLLTTIYKDDTLIQFVSICICKVT